MSLNVYKCLQMYTLYKCLQMSPNVYIETFSPYRLHQSLIPNVLPAQGQICKEYDFYIPIYAHILVIQTYLKFKKDKMGIAKKTGKLI